MMSDLSELLTDAEEEPRPSRMVRVCVKPSVAVERARLLDAVERAMKADAATQAGDQRFGVEPVPVTAAQDEARRVLDVFDETHTRALVELKFTRMDGAEWALLTSTNPIRVDVALDRHYGYNYDAVSEAAARATGVVVTDDGEVPVAAGEWDRLFKILSGHDVEKIRDAVWVLNEYEPSLHVDALVKDFGAA